MRIHFIAIGGSAMHNLAIALHKKGYEVSGSDDEIFEPSKSRLAKYNLLPSKTGWNPENIEQGIDAIILGMHAKADNPELLAAKKLGLPIYSYPEYIALQSANKKRVVIAGSHGKTSITSMVLHVLQKVGLDFDYLVGAQLEGFETMVKISDAPIIVLEGDEYLSSPIDRKPKFLWYKPQIAVISGIAWDHINVFPTFEDYINQFETFIKSLPENAKLFYCELDQELKKIASSNSTIEAIPYSTHSHKIIKGKTIVEGGNESYTLSFFGDHNLQNLSAAKNICFALGITSENFYKAILSFKGAAKRLEKIAENESSIVYKDFAHSPSKLKATTAATKKQFPEHQLIACMELHTFSSLNKDFLKEYAGAMNAADRAIVYFNPNTLVHKGLESISKAEVEQAFLPGKIEVYTNSDEVKAELQNTDLKQSVLLLMTSGNFNGIDLNAFAESLLNT